MAIQQLQIIVYPQCHVSLTYDDLTLAVSAVQGVNNSPSDCFLRVQNGLNSAQQASGTLAANGTRTFALPAGALTLTHVVRQPDGATVLSFDPWILSSRWPA